MKCKNCEWYDDDTNTCNHPASPKSYEDVGPDDGCDAGSLKLTVYHFIRAEFARE